jgi:glucose uptake protein GlcU
MASPEVAAPAVIRPTPTFDAARLRALQLVGVSSGLTAGAWLGAAEAPTKLATAGLSPVLVSFCMVLGVFLARWSLPAIVHGASYVRADVLKARHLVLWAVLGGCLWAVANTLTIFAIRDLGLSLAFPLWNTNSLLGIVWGVVFFGELKGASWQRRLAVVGGAVLMCLAASVVAAASVSQTAPGHAMRGVITALTAGALWGTMYIPYRKAYVTGMSPLSFLTFFTIGELVTVGLLALGDAGGILPLWHSLVRVQTALFWLLLGGFVWVIGDLFQQYAAKYVGISRGIPLSNTNQLWGLLWGVLVFGELSNGGASRTVILEAVGGSVAMVLGAGAIALASAGGREHDHWEAAAMRETTRYGVDARFSRARRWGTDADSVHHKRTWFDWAIVVCATSVFIALARLAAPPLIVFHAGWAAALILLMLGALAACGWLIWRVTAFA